MRSPSTTTAAASTTASSTNAKHRRRRRRSDSNNEVTIRVCHNYHDHAQDLIPENKDIDFENFCHKESAPFPLKLFDMVTSATTQQYEHVLSWQPHGRCFLIHQPQEFVHRVMPKFLPRISKLASFQRQLNLYGFQRITQGKDKGSYYHELFLRGKPFLAHQIQRCKVKGTGVRGKSNPEEEPMFWNMEWVGVAVPQEQQQQQEKKKVHDSTVLIQETHKNRHKTEPSSSLLPGSVVISSSSSSSSPQEDLGFVVSSSGIVSEDDHSLTSSSGGGGVESNSSIRMMMMMDEDNTNDDNMTTTTTTPPILCEWGQTFYALDQLPDDYPTSSPPPPVVAVAPKTTMMTTTTY